MATAPTQAQGRSPYSPRDRTANALKSITYGSAAAPLLANRTVTFGTENKRTPVAHDLGVRVAQELLARREERMGQAAIAGLILLNGAMCPEAYRPRPIQRLLASPLGRWIGPRVPRASFDRAVRDLFGPHTPPSQDLLDDFWTLLEHGGGRRMTHAVGRFWLPRLAMRERLVGALLRSAVPLRVINGAADPNSGRHMVQRLRELSPDVEVISLNQIGHWPQIEDCAATGEAIVQFIQRNPG